MHSRLQICLVYFFICIAITKQNSLWRAAFDDIDAEEEDENDNKRRLPDIFYTTHEIPEGRPEFCSAYGEEYREYHFCPTGVVTVDEKGRNKTDYICIRYADLCNGFTSCPGGEDEEGELCELHLRFKRHLAYEVTEFAKEEAMRGNTISIKTP